MSRGAELCNQARLQLVCSATESSKSLKYAYRQIYRKFPKYSDTQKLCSNHSKILTKWLYHGVMCPNDADGMANSADPDQTAPLGAV